MALNAWFGPAGTVSCLHYDRPHNLLCQVVGHKRISTTEKYLELIDDKEESRGIKLKEL